MDTKPNRIRGGKRHTRSTNGAADQAHRQEFRRDVHLEASKLIPHLSPTARIPEGGVFADGDGFSIRETYDPIADKIVEVPIGDKSLTAQLFLGILPQRPTEKILIIGHQYDRVSKKMILTTDEQVLAMSDRTLLRRGNPFAQATDINRQTSISKRIEYNVDANMINRQSVMDERREANQPGVDLDSFIEAAERGGKPLATVSTGKRTSGTILGAKQRKRK